MLCALFQVVFFGKMSKIVMMNSESGSMIFKLYLLSFVCVKLIKMCQNNQTLFPWRYWKRAVLLLLIYKFISKCLRISDQVTNPTPTMFLSKRSARRTEHVLPWSQDDNPLRYGSISWICQHVYCVNIPGYNGRGNAGQPKIPARITLFYPFWFRSEKLKHMVCFAFTKKAGWSTKKKYANTRATAHANFDHVLLSVCCCFRFNSKINPTESRIAARKTRQLNSVSADGSSAIF